MLNTESEKRLKKEKSCWNYPEKSNEKHDFMQIH